jgi:hypothetical protein
MPVAATVRHRREARLLSSLSLSPQRTASWRRASIAIAGFGSKSRAARPRSSRFRRASPIRPRAFARSPSVSARSSSRTCGAGGSPPRGDQPIHVEVGALLLHGFPIVTAGCESRWRMLEAERPRRADIDVARRQDEASATSRGCTPGRWCRLDGLCVGLVGADMAATPSATRTPRANKGSPRVPPGLQGQRLSAGVEARPACRRRGASSKKRVCPDTLTTGP